MTKRHSVSERILAIRAAARAKLSIECSERCPTCARPYCSPHRVYNERGKVVEGCVDACHTGKLIGESRHWQDRREADSIRRVELNRIQE